MAYEFLFPDVGEGLTEGRLVKWTVKEGDNIATDDTVAEVETDKAVVRIPSPVSGTVSKLLYKDGDILETGKVIMEIETGETSKKDVKEEPKTPVIKEEKPVIQKAKSDGILALPKIRKAAKKHNLDLSQVSGSGKHGEITADDISQGQSSHVEKLVKKEQEQPKTQHDILASPSVRTLARSLHVDLSVMKGTGDHGHITSQDVKNAVGKRVDSGKNIHPSLHKEPAAVSDGSEERIPLSTARKRIAKGMMESLQNTAQVTFSDEADVTELVAIREQEKNKLKEQGIKLSFLPFFIKAATIALQKHPGLNAKIDGEELVKRNYYNIGIAVDTPNGLIVPVIKNTDKKSIVQLAQELSKIAVDAREGTLDLAHLTGSTFTISSVGNLGGEMFTPILNYPDVGLLGIGKIADKAVVRNNAVAIRKIVTLSLTFDHRANDGADAARFMKTLISLVEDPHLLFLSIS